MRGRPRWYRVVLETMETVFVSSSFTRLRLEDIFACVLLDFLAFRARLEGGRSESLTARTESLEQRQMTDVLAMLSYLSVAFIWPHSASPIRPRQLSMT